MSAGKPSPDISPPDLEALASEVCDLWQDYINALAGQSAAKADFVRLLEPQRRLFADFMTMMQHGRDGTASPASTAAKPHAASAGAAPPAGSSDDSALRMAQLAHRVAELEKRLNRLEAAPGAGSRRGAGKTPHSRA